MGRLVLASLSRATRATPRAAASSSGAAGAWSSSARRWRRFSSSSGGGATPYEFDEAMALEPVEGRRDIRVFRGFITDRWSFGNAPNGGILTSLAISAARKVVGHQDPLSVSTHFVRKARENVPVTLQVEQLAASRSQETVRVALLQPLAMSERQAARAHFLMTFGTLGNFKGMDMRHLNPPPLPPRLACVDIMAALRQGPEGANFRIADRLELHMPPDVPFVRAMLRNEAVDAAAEPCVMEGWARLRDGRWPCLRSMALFNDGFPAPVHSHTLAALGGAEGAGGPPRWVWVPTVELSTHFWERPPKRDKADGTAEASYLRLRFTTPFVRRGLLMCDSEVWDAEGATLYSSSRQYARLLVPR